MQAGFDKSFQGQEQQQEQQEQQFRVQVYSSLALKR
jgi:hypothetical protein